MRFEAQIEHARYGNAVALENLSLRAEAGEIVGILGANGAGKTTSLLAIMGNVVSKTRRLSLDGVDVSRLATWNLARHGIGFCPDGAWCFADLTVLENLRSVFTVGASDRGRDGRGPFEEVFEIFPVLKRRQSQFAGTLSGGEKRMLAVGRVLMLRPKVMILDEPSSGLSPKLVGELYRAIIKIKRNSNAAIILAEQNASVCLKVSDHCVVLEQGRVVLEGPSSGLRENEEVRKAYLGV